MSDILERLRAAAEYMDYYSDIELLNDAAAEIERLRTLVAREGWKLVPIEPTEEMVKAGGDAFYDAIVGHVAGDIVNANRPFRRYYRAMLAATPPAPRTSGETGGE